MSYWRTSIGLTIILYGIHELREHSCLAGEKLKSQSFEKLKHIKMLHYLCLQEAHSNAKHPPYS